MGATAATIHGAAHELGSANHASDGSNKGLCGSALVHDCTTGVSDLRTLNGNDTTRPNQIEIKRHTAGKPTRCQLSPFALLEIDNPGLCQFFESSGQVRSAAMGEHSPGLEGRRSFRPDQTEKHQIFSS